MLYRIEYKSLINGFTGNGDYIHTNRSELQEYVNSLNLEYKGQIQHWIGEYLPKIGDVFYKNQEGIDYFLIVQESDGSIYLATYDYENRIIKNGYTTSIGYAIRQGYRLAATVEN